MPPDYSEKTQTKGDNSFYTKKIQNREGGFDTGS